MQKAKLNCKQMNGQCGLNEAVIRHRLCKWGNTQYAVMLYHMEVFGSKLFSWICHSCVCFLVLFHFSRVACVGGEHWPQQRTFKRAKAFIILGPITSLILFVIEAITLICVEMATKEKNLCCLRKKQGSLNS